MARLHDVVRRRNSETEIQEREVLKQFGKEKFHAMYLVLCKFHFFVLRNISKFLQRYFIKYISKYSLMKGK